MPSSTVDCPLVAKYDIKYAYKLKVVLSSENIEFEACSRVFRSNIRSVTANTNFGVK